MKFLVLRKKSKLSRLDGEIKLIKDELFPHKEDDEYKERSANLKKVLEKEEIKQKNKKRKTFNQDVGDYKTGIVFNWQNKIAIAEGESRTPIDSGGNLSHAITLKHLILLINILYVQGDHHIGPLTGTRDLK